MIKPTEEQVIVTQADRDAAASLATVASFDNDADRACAIAGASEVVAGLQDEHPTVRAFARHRAISEARLLAERDELRAAKDQYHAALKDIAADRFVPYAERGRVSLERRDIARAALASTDHAR